MKYLKQKAIFEIFLIVTLSIIISISYSQPVSAAENVCCEKTKSGQWCQYVDSSECEPNNAQFPGTCDSFESCQPVTCDLSTVPGVFSCQSTVSKSTCRELGGTPLQGDIETFPQCQLGCCLLGSQSKFTIERGCTDLANTLGVPQEDIQFMPEIQTELECIDLALRQRTGCCIAENKDCSMAVGTQCEGEFFADTFCSALPQGKCDQCKGEKVKQCIEGSADVWNYDKCGNRESIAEQCNYAVEGKACGEVDKNVRCIDLSCGKGTEKGKELWDNPRVDENKDGNYEGDVLVRKHGDSWCQYDGDSGPTIDLPGSRHFRHSCIDGVEVVEECADYRSEICISGSLDSDERTLNFASCIPNNSESCYTCKDKECCEDETKRGCLWTGQDNPTNGYCLPLVPPGQPFDTGDSSCNVASSNFQDGPVKPSSAVWVEEVWFDCEAGCSVYTKQFLKGMNSICNSYGDCGAGYNLLGQWSKNGFRRSTSTVQDNEEFDEDDEGDVNDENAMKILRTEPDIKGKWDCDINDGDDCAYVMLKRFKDNPQLTKDEGLFAENYKFNKGILDLGNIVSGDVEDISWYEFYKTKGSWVGFGGGIIIGGLSTAGLLGVLGEAVWTYLAISTSLGPLGVIIAIGGIVVAAIVAWLTWPEEIKDEVNVFCSAWQSPVGGEYCNLCHEKGSYTYKNKDETTVTEEIDFTANGLHECTEYLCKSLGARCEYLDTEDGARCIDQNPSDVIPPIIRSLENLELHCVPTSGGAVQAEVPCEIVDHGDTGFEIKPFIKPRTHVQFGVKTCKDTNCNEQEFAICKYDTERKQNIDELTRAFQQTGYSNNHNTTLIAGSDLEPGNKYQFYVKCQDKSGLENPQDYQISFEVAQEPDTTPPQITEINHNGLVASHINVTQIGLTLNERADCKFSRHDLPYEEMEKEAQCFARQGELPSCTAPITNITESEQLFFFRCKDKANNANQQSFPNNGFLIRKTPPLIIEDIKCIHQYGESCEDDIFQKNVTLQILTKDGAESGKAKCGASTTGSDNPEFLFQETDSSLHKQTIGPLDTGDKRFNLICEDSAGNKASNEITAKIRVDEITPVIQKLYLLNQVFTVETDEITACNLAKTLSMEEPEQMTTGDGTVHISQVSQGEIIYLQCVDRFNNQGPIYQVTFSNE